MYLVVIVRLRNFFKAIVWHSEIPSIALKLMVSLTGLFLLESVIQKFQRLTIFNNRALQIFRNPLRNFSMYLQ